MLSAITPDSTPTTGNANIKVGATITVASGQTPGTYTGSLTATATYDGFGRLQSETLYDGTSTTRVAAAEERGLVASGGSGPLPTRVV